MWEYCVDEAEKKKKGHQGTPPQLMRNDCSLPTDNWATLTNIFQSNKDADATADATEESKDISDKYILNQNNNNSFYMLLRVELLQSMWPRHILTVPGLSSATALWLRETVYAIQVLNTLKSCFFQSPLDLPLEMHRLTWPSGIVQTYQHTTRSVV